MEFVARMTGDAKVQTLKNDRKVVNFTVAINDGYKDKATNEYKKQVLFVQCAYWISTAVAERLKRGTIVELNGRFYVSAYKDMEGEAKAGLHCHVNSIKVHGNVQTGEAKSKEQEASALKEPLDDLPF